MLSPDAAQQIGRYEIIEEIATGPVGQVFRGYDQEFSRYVAIKVARDEILVPESAISSCTPSRTRGDGGTRERLPHLRSRVGRCPAVYRFAVHRRRNARSVESAQHRLPPIMDALDRVLGLARGLSVLHAAGIVHFALKPDNIFVDASTFLIADHGWAQPDGDRATAHAHGTRYMSPEQWRTGRKPHPDRTTVRHLQSRSDAV